MDTSHTPITVENWLGMYTRGVTDSTPQGYLLNALNVRYSEGDVFTRDGSTKILSLGGIVRFSIYKRLGEQTRYIYLNDSGQLFDSLYPNTPIWTDASFVDFSGANFNNRYYITPHNRVTGIPGKYLLLYDGSGTARVAAGPAPIGFSLGAANSASSGNVEAGTHIIAVCFVSDSGFISAPGPPIHAVLVATGGLKIDISNLPIGPAGTVARVLVATKAIASYNGNQDGYQFFIVSSIDGGLVANNTNTTATLSFFDSELQADATYLFSNRGLIPAGVCITNYNGRLCLAGINGDEHSVYISKPFDPEQMDENTGFIVVDPFESGNGITNLFNHKGNFIICKSHKLYATIDNQDDPVTWSTAQPIDEGTGTECFGISTILDKKGQQTDRTFIADRSGLVIFDGYVKRPEGSWLVEDTWKRINKDVFNLIQVCIDVESSSIFVSMPLDGSTSISHILYGYYGNAYGPYGFDPKLIKFALWDNVNLFTCITTTEDTDSSSVLLFSNSGGGIYKIKNDQSVHNDAGLPFQSLVQTALYTTKPKWTQHLSLIGLRVIGHGILKTVCKGQQDVDSQVLRDKTMSTTDALDLEIKANFQSARVSISLSTGDNLDEYFRISRMDLYLKPMWMSRPG